MPETCEHKSKKMLERKVLEEEELPGAYCATVVKTTYQLIFQCRDCGEKWVETKNETKFY